MSKHTPGPWLAPCFVRGCSKCQCTWILSDKYFGSIATVSVDNEKRIEYGGNDSPPYDEALANARLIAAAPELLELAESLGDIFVGTCNDCEKVCAAKMKAEALIARIEGETDEMS